MIFDSHAHYNDRAFDQDVNELLSSMPENNIGAIMNACSNLSEMKKIIELSQKFSFVYGSVGIHPDSAEKITGEIGNAIKEYARKDKILAIGEIGLDYHYEDIPREIQKDCFDSQLSLADELEMPVIIHDREAHKDTLDLVSLHKGISGVFHCFSGSKEMAREVLDLGFYIAFGGSVTFKNNVKIVEAARYVPLDKIVVETDCPYLAPVPNRGKRNSSLNLNYVIEKIAEVKNITAGEVERATWENACGLFNTGRI